MVWYCCNCDNSVTVAPSSAAEAEEVREQQQQLARYFLPLLGGGGWVGGGGPAPGPDSELLLADNWDKPAHTPPSPDTTATHTATATITNMKTLDINTYYSSMHV